jgi:hypothetical protein
MNFKKGVDVTGLHPMMLIAIITVNDIFREKVGADAVITSGRDGKHSRASFHYSGLALDWRTRHLDQTQLAIAVQAMQDRLEPQGFDVILERDHIHLEYQPKYGELPGNI